ncbi:hypothetical protein [Secundilactobacillus kimchicus]|uniref:hypothetical protein n=1 Tax=Secundilactobacillus kimchicus TaxID=528209 RepID=UPI0006CFAD8E|nr:hypothetical protein [Secundilactobacillus kimchicus]
MILKGIWDLIKFIAGLIFGWLLPLVVLGALALGLPLLLLTLPLWILPAILTVPFWLPILLGLLPFLIGAILAALAKGLWDLLKLGLGAILGWLFAPLVFGALALGLPLLLLTLPLWILPALLTLPLWLPLLLAALPLLLGKLFGALAKAFGTSLSSWPAHYLVLCSRQLFLAP